MEENITRLPGASREEQLERWGLDGSAHWAEAKRWGHGPDDAVAEPPSGADATERELEERGFLVGGGWHPADIKNSKNATGGWDGGLTSHRGALHPDEYVDDDLLISLIEQELGFTYEQIRAVYRPGRPTNQMRELRGQIDARLLALSRSGGNLIELARRLGFGIDTNRRVCDAFESALARARAAEEVAS